MADSDALTPENHLHLASGALNFADQVITDGGSRSLRSSYLTIAREHIELALEAVKDTLRREATINMGARPVAPAADKKGRKRPVVALPIMPR